MCMQMCVFVFVCVCGACNLLGWRAMCASAAATVCLPVCTCVRIAPCVYLCVFVFLDICSCGQFES
jgi:hypothetical protein